MDRIFPFSILRCPSVILWGFGPVVTLADSATRNAGEMIDKLTLFLNRVRQASITTELIEVVSGAQALE